jgi:hypothetical protein
MIPETGCLTGGYNNGKEILRHEGGELPFPGRHIPLPSDPLVR